LLVFLGGQGAIRERERVRAGAPVGRGVLRVFHLAVGLVLAAPICGAALPSAVPIRAVIRVGLAALSGPDPPPIPDPAVWRFRHGEGWVFRGPGVRWRGGGF